jgi:DNA repair protein RadC
VDLCNEILASTQNNLVELSRLSIPALMNFKGIGEAKAISIAAALELGRRRRSAEVLAKPKVTGSKDVFEAMAEKLMDLNHEEFWIILLNRANKIMKRIQISEGGFSGTVADPKKIFALALENNASALVLCHNHPSGNTEPSAVDKKLTRKMVEAGQVLDLPVLDHLIFGDENYFSFADKNLI